MATVIGTGISVKLDSFAAGKEAAQLAYYQLGRRDPGIIITFISTIFNQEEAIKGIRSIMKETPLVGCSSAGSISASGSFEGSVSVFTISSDSLSFSCGIGKEVSKNARAAGHKAATGAQNTLNNKKQAYVMFSDGLSGNGADILRGAQEALGTSFPIIGGSATDNLYFQQTYQYLDSVYTDSVAGLLISGNINIGIGKANAWQPIGKPHKITKAKSNIIKEIDKKVAVEIYEEYFEKSFEELKKEGIAKLGINYPMGIKKGQGYLIRVPLKIEDNGSIVFSADIPEGEDVGLMIGDKILALESATEACKEAVKDIRNSRIKFATVFVDIGHLQLLRKESQKQIEIISSILGRDVPIIGCYTCGEYAPFDIYESKGESCFNNQVISIAVFSE